MLRAAAQDEQERCAKLQAENVQLRAYAPREATTSLRGASGAAEALRAPVQRLQKDYEDRTEMMEDDLDFIAEVTAGDTRAASEFNAEMVRARACLATPCSLASSLVPSPPRLSPPGSRRDCAAAVGPARSLSRPRPLAPSAHACDCRCNRRDVVRRAGCLRSLFFAPSWVLDAQSRNESVLNELSSRRHFALLLATPKLVMHAPPAPPGPYSYPLFAPLPLPAPRPAKISSHLHRI